MKIEKINNEVYNDRVNLHYSKIESYIGVDLDLKLTMEIFEPVRTYYIHENIWATTWTICSDQLI